jgi:hypothetical protein
MLRVQNPGAFVLILAAATTGLTLGITTPLPLIFIIPIALIVGVIAAALVAIRFPGPRRKAGSDPGA